VSEFKKELTCISKKTSAYIAKSNAQVVKSSYAYYPEKPIEPFIMDKSNRNSNSYKSFKIIFSAMLFIMVFLAASFLIFAESPGLSIKKIFDFNKKYQKCFDYHRDAGHACRSMDLF
jgi:hypothetical protein